MAEIKTSQRRTMGARLGRGYSALAGVGAIGVALLMMASPASAATAASVLSAPYHGAESPNNDNYIQGCSHVTDTKLWKFNMKTGLGGAINSGSAATCKKQTAGVGTYGDAEVDGGFDLAIPLKVTSGNHSVSANLAWAIAGLLKASDGLPVGSSGACNYGITSYYDKFADYSWNYAKTPAGYYTYNSYNDSEVDKESSGFNYVYHQGTGPTPHPFLKNNTSYEDVGYQYGANGDCDSSVSFDMGIDGTLLDTSNGTDMTQTGNTLESCTLFLGIFYSCTPVVEVTIQIINETYWYCGKSVYWDGPSNTSIVTPFSCYNGNLTLTSTVQVYYPSTSASLVTGTNNSVSLTLPTGGTGGMWWNDTFNGKHHYVLLVDLYADSYADVSWKKGTASFTLNALTSGNGIDLRSISVV